MGDQDGIHFFQKLVRTIVLLFTYMYIDLFLVW